MEGFWEANLGPPLIELRREKPKDGKSDFEMTLMVTSILIHWNV